MNNTVCFDILANCTATTALCDSYASGSGSGSYGSSNTMIKLNDEFIRFSGCNSTADPMSYVNLCANISASLTDTLISMICQYNISNVTITNNTIANNTIANVTRNFVNLYRLIYVINGTTAPPTPQTEEDKRANLIVIIVASTVGGIIAIIVLIVYWRHAATVVEQARRNRQLRHTHTEPTTDHSMESV